MSKYSIFDPRYSARVAPLVISESIYNERKKSSKKIKIDRMIKTDAVVVNNVVKEPNCVESVKEPNSVESVKETNSVKSVKPKQSIKRWITSK